MKLVLTLSSRLLCVLVSIFLTYDLFGQPLVVDQLRVLTSSSGSVSLNGPEVFELGMAGDVWGISASDFDEGGFVRVSLYFEDTTRADRKGEQFYGGTLDVSSYPSFKSFPLGTPLSIQDSFDASKQTSISSDNLKRYLLQANSLVPDGLSNPQQCHVLHKPSLGIRDIKGLIINQVPVFIDLNAASLSPECKAYYSQVADYQSAIPVVVEVMIKGATLHQLKLPGIGILDTDIFAVDRPSVYSSVHFERAQSGHLLGWGINGSSDVPFFRSSDGEAIFTLGDIIASGFRGASFGGEPFGLVGSLSSFLPSFILPQNGLPASITLKEDAEVDGREYPQIGSWGSIPIYSIPVDLLELKLIGTSSSGYVYEGLSGRDVLVSPPGVDLPELLHGQVVGFDESGLAQLDVAVYVSSTISLPTTDQLNGSITLEVYPQHRTYRYEWYFDEEIYTPELQAEDQRMTARALGSGDYRVVITDVLDRSKTVTKEFRLGYHQVNWTDLVNLSQGTANSLHLIDEHYSERSVGFANHFFKAGQNSTALLKFDSTPWQWSGDFTINFYSAATGERTSGLSIYQSIPVLAENGAGPLTILEHNQTTLSNDLLSEEWSDDETYITGGSELEIVVSDNLISYYYNGLLLVEHPRAFPGLLTMGVELRSGHLPEMQTNVARLDAVTLVEDAVSHSEEVVHLEATPPTLFAALESLNRASLADFSALKAAHGGIDNLLQFAGSSAQPHYDEFMLQGRLLSDYNEVFTSQLASYESLAVALGSASEQVRDLVAADHLSVSDHGVLQVYTDLLHDLLHGRTEISSLESVPTLPLWLSSSARVVSSYGQSANQALLSAEHSASALLVSALKQDASPLHQQEYNNNVDDEYFPIITMPVWSLHVPFSNQGDPREGSAHLTGYAFSPALSLHGSLYPEGSRLSSVADREGSLSPGAALFAADQSLELPAVVVPGQRSTLSYWVKIEDPESVTRQAIYTLESSQGIGAGMVRDGQRLVSLGAQDSDWGNYEISFDQPGWYHIVEINHPNDRFVYFYKPSSANHPEFGHIRISTPSDQASNPQLFIGASATFLSTYQSGASIGIVDDFRFYDQALTQAQVAVHHREMRGSYQKAQAQLFSFINQSQGFKGASNLNLYLQDYSKESLDAFSDGLNLLFKADKLLTYKKKKIDAKFHQAVMANEPLAELQLFQAMDQECSDILLLLTRSESELVTAIRSHTLSDEQVYTTIQGLYDRVENLGEALDLVHGSYSLGTRIYDTGVEELVHFGLLDLDGDRQISLHEGQLFFMTAESSAESLSAFAASFAQYDVNGNGSLSTSEYHGVGTNIEDWISEEELLARSPLYSYTKTKAREFKDTEGDMLHVYCPDLDLLTPVEDGSGVLLYSANSFTNLPLTRLRKRSFGHTQILSYLPPSARIGLTTGSVDGGGIGLLYLGFKFRSELSETFSSMKSFLRGYLPYEVRYAELAPTFRRAGITPEQIELDNLSVEPEGSVGRLSEEVLDDWGWTGDSWEATLDKESESLMESLSETTSESLVLESVAEASFLSEVAGPVGAIAALLITPVTSYVINHVNIGRERTQIYNDWEMFLSETIKKRDYYASSLELPYTNLVDISRSQVSTMIRKMNMASLVGQTSAAGAIIADHERRYTITITEPDLNNDECLSGLPGLASRYTYEKEELLALDDISRSYDELTGRKMIAMVDQLHTLKYIYHNALYNAERYLDLAKDHHDGSLNQGPLGGNVFGLDKQQEQLSYARNYLCRAMIQLQYLYYAHDKIVDITSKTTLNDILTDLEALEGNSDLEESQLYIQTYAALIDYGLTQTRENVVSAVQYRNQLVALEGVTDEQLATANQAAADGEEALADLQAILDGFAYQVPVVAVDEAACDEVAEAIAMGAGSGSESYEYHPKLTALVESSDELALLSDYAIQAVELAPPTSPCAIVYEGYQRAAGEAISDVHREISELFSRTDIYVMIAQYARLTVEDLYDYLLEQKRASETDLFLELMGGVHAEQVDLSFKSDAYGTTLGFWVYIDELIDHSDLLDLYTYQHSTGSTKLSLQGQQLLLDGTSDWNNPAMIFDQSGWYHVIQTQFPGTGDRGLNMVYLFKPEGQGKMEVGYQEAITLLTDDGTLTLEVPTAQTDYVINYEQELEVYPKPFTMLEVMQLHNAHKGEQIASRDEFVSYFTPAEQWFDLSLKRQASRSAYDQFSVEDQSKLLAALSDYHQAGLYLFNAKHAQVHGEYGQREEGELITFADTHDRLNTTLSEDLVALVDQIKVFEPTEAFITQLAQSKAEAKMLFETGLETDRGLYEMGFSQVSYQDLNYDTSDAGISRDEMGYFFDDLRPGWEAVYDRFDTDQNDYLSQAEFEAPGINSAGEPEVISEANSYLLYAGFTSSAADPYHRQPVLLSAFEGIMLANELLTAFSMDGGMNYTMSQPSPLFSFVDSDHFSLRSAEGDQVATYATHGFMTSLLFFEPGWETDTEPVAYDIYQSQDSRDGLDRGSRGLGNNPPGGSSSTSNYEGLWDDYRATHPVSEFGWHPDDPKNPINRHDKLNPLNFPPYTPSSASQPDSYRPIAGELPDDAWERWRKSPEGVAWRLAHPGEYYHPNDPMCPKSTDETDWSDGGGESEHPLSDLEAIAANAAMNLGDQTILPSAPFDFFGPWVDPSDTNTPNEYEQEYKDIPASISPPFFRIEDSLFSQETDDSAPDQMEGVIKKMRQLFLEIKIEINSKREGLLRPTMYPYLSGLVRLNPNLSIHALIEVYNNELEAFEPTLAQIEANLVRAKESYEAAKQTKGTAARDYQNNPDEDNRSSLQMATILLADQENKLNDAEAKLAKALEVKYKFLTERKRFMVFLNGIRNLIKIHDRVSLLLLSFEPKENEEKNLYIKFNEMNFDSKIFLGVFEEYYLMSSIAYRRAMAAIRLARERYLRELIKAADVYANYLEKSDAEAKLKDELSSVQFNISVMEVLGNGGQEAITNAIAQGIPIPVDFVISPSEANNQLQELYQKETKLKEALDQTQREKAIASITNAVYRHVRVRAARNQLEAIYASADQMQWDAQAYLEAQLPGLLDQGEALSTEVETLLNEYLEEIGDDGSIVSQYLFGSPRTFNLARTLRNSLEITLRLNDALRRIFGLLAIPRLSNSRNLTEEALVEELKGVREEILASFHEELAGKIAWAKVPTSPTHAHARVTEELIDEEVTEEASEEPIVTLSDGVYPNPTSGLVQVAVNLDKATQLTFILLNIEGAKMYERTLSAHKGYQVIDLGDLKSDIGIRPNQLCFFGAYSQEGKKLLNVKLLFE